MFVFSKGFISLLLITVFGILVLLGFSQHWASFQSPPFMMASVDFCPLFCLEWGLTQLQ